MPRKTIVSLSLLSLLVASPPRHGQAAEGPAIYPPASFFALPRAALGGPARLTITRAKDRSPGMHSSFGYAFSTSQKIVGYTVNVYNATADALRACQAMQVYATGISMYNIGSVYLPGTHQWWFGVSGAWPSGTKDVDATVKAAVVRYRNIIFIALSAAVTPSDQRAQVRLQAYLTSQATTLASALYRRAQSFPGILHRPASVLHQPTTIVRVFHPYDAQGNIRAALSVVGVSSGSCWTDSEASDRPDAYRCMAGNYILDPCFASEQAVGQVACAQSPIDGKVTLLDLTQPLPQHYSPPTPITQEHPWLVILADGDTCTFLQGATAAIGQMRLNYGCARGSIYGDIDQSHEPWTALFWHGFTVTPSQKSQLTPVTVKVAWY